VVWVLFGCQEGSVVVYNTGKNNYKGESTKGKFKDISFESNTHLFKSI